MVGDGDRRVEWRRLSAPGSRSRPSHSCTSRTCESQALARSRVHGIVGEQRPVAAEVRPASAGVADDRVVALRRQQVDHPSRKLAGSCPGRRCARAASRSTAAAAASRRCSRWRAAHRPYHGSRPDRRDPARSPSAARLDTSRADAGCSRAAMSPFENAGCHTRRLRLEPPRLAGSRPIAPERRTSALQAGALIQPQGPCRRAKCPRTLEEEPQRDGAPEFPRCSRC